MAVRHLLLFTCLLAGIRLQGIDIAPPDSVVNKRLTVLPVPGFGYAPETKAYVAAICLFSYRLGSDSLTRPSNSKVEVNFTQRRQLILEAGWNVFTNREKYISSGKLHFSSFPDYFWPMSANQKNGNENRVTYNSNRILAEVQVLKKLSSYKKWFAGPSLRYIRYSHIRYMDGDSQIMRDLNFTEFICPLGLSVLKDSRNNPLLAEKGIYLQSTLQWMWGTRRNYPKVMADLRKYWSKGPMAVALRSKTVYSGGPVLDAALFGGDETARGYYLGRFRSSAFSSFQAELRYTVYRRWGLAIFGGYSYVKGASDFNHMMLPNYGTGLRFRIDRRENINLRFDYALGTRGNSGFYVAFGESF